MCEICANSSLKVNVKQYDPTHTLTLRQSFVTEMNRRFKRIAKSVTEAVVTDDVFGLTTDNSITVQARLPKRAFVLRNKADKIQAFIDWLRTVESAVLFEMKPDASYGALREVPWYAMYLAKAYEQGSKRAQQEIKRAGLNIVLGDGAGNVLVNPVAVEKLLLIFTRAFTDLEGITAAMDAQISRILAEGLIEGQSPITLARMINSAIIGGGDSLGLDISYINKSGNQVTYFMEGRRRAEILARTEIIRSHHLATVAEYRAWEVEGVYVLAEWATAGDNRVCIKCAPLQGTIWDLDTIETMIPYHPQCFIDPQIPIYTSRGWKHIGEIKVGDRVLTHKRRFKKVTHLVRGKKVCDVVKFRFERNHLLTVTDNHPILVHSEGVLCWKEAKNVTKKDTVRFLANKCARCGKLIPFDKKYCSQSCISKDITERQWSDPAHRENVSKKNSIANKEQYETGKRDRSTATKKANEKTRQMVADGTFGTWMNEEFFDRIRKATNTKEMRVASSKRMIENNPMFRPEIVEKTQKKLEIVYRNNPEKRLNARLAGNRWKGKLTYIEQRMATLLDSLGIEYISQYPILRYNVDFAIPSLKIVIECDGEYWHTDKRKDRIRQRKIEKEGWFVLRYSGSMINKCLEDVGKEIKRVINNHSGRYNLMDIKITSIEKFTTKRCTPTYNLSVEEDESYIAKGVVVHNCRCCVIPYVDKTKTK